MGYVTQETDEDTASPTKPTSAHALSHALSRLPSPLPFDIRVLDLTIGVPPRSPLLPLPIPIPIPKFLLFSKPDLDGPKSIIRNISAECHSGEMLAIIGGSGSGKTTLLHAIVGRLANLPILNGTVTFQPVHSTTARVPALDSSHMRHRIGFVRQNDYLLPHLTVRETLSYAAALRLPTGVPRETRDLIVEETIQELGLQDAADTVVGGMFRKGISGGERRRLSIGCILVSHPSVLCLDEPTTGLDATTAFSILLTLSRLSRRNRTIILSIHQPRSDAYALFSRIVLLSRGSVVYAGLRSRCLSYFDTHLGMAPPPEGMNVLDWLVDISVVDVRTSEKEEQSRQRVAQLVDVWRAQGTEWNKREYEEKATPSPRDSMPLSGPAGVEWDGGTGEYMRPGVFAQTLTLTHRANKNVYRNLGQMAGFACQSMIVGILLAIIFYRLPETPSGIQSLKTLAYAHLPAYYYLTLIYMVYRFCETDLVVFDRDQEDHLYTVPPYILSEIIANFPVNVFFTTIFALIVYFVCHLRTSNLPFNLFIFISLNVLVQLCTVGFALLVASLQRVYAQASLIANGIQLFLLIPAGYLLITLPVYVRWIKWISVYFHGFRIAMISQFRDRRFACHGVTGVALSQCHGNAVLRGLHISPSQRLATHFAALIGIFIVLNVLAGIVLAYYHPGGVNHAQQVNDGKEHSKSSAVIGDLDIPWVKVDVEARALGFKWSRRSAGSQSLGLAISWLLTEVEVERTILSDVNVRFPAGEVTAILGPSGAGKSSLLQLLASREMNPGPFASFETEGVITFNGQPLKKNMRSLVGFVEQDDDHHYPALTVRETLRYAAMLRLPKDVPRKRKLARAEEVLYMLGLGECANTLVGGPLLKGISGGEKRRLSLAVQMISDPSILIADEPTSGLDALTASNVMNALNQIATISGRTVIVTLHQPRSDIYQLIDNVVVLAKGGRVAYSGPRSEVGPSFSNAGFPIPELFNPADFLLDTLSNPTRVGHMIDIWQKSKLARTSEASGQQEKPLYDNMGVRVSTSTAMKTPMYIALSVVVERMVKNLWRQQSIFWIRLQQAPILAVLYLLFYQRLKKNAEGGQDRIGFLQEFILAVPFIGLLNGVAIFPFDRNLFLHEYRSSASYSAVTFILAFTIVELPLQILSSLLYTVLLNVAAGMQTNARIFFQDATAVFCMQSFGESIGIAFACLAQSIGLNISLVSTALTVFGQICGVVSVSVPKWLNILAWSTITKYAARIVATNEFVGLKLDCSPESIASGRCLAQTGEELLNIVGFRDLRTGRFLGIMIALTVLNRLLALGVLQLKLWQM